MRNLFTAIAILTGLAFAPDALAQSSPCQLSTTGTVGGIPCQRLPGLFFAPAPGTGLEAEAIVGVVETDNLGTGTAGATTFLRGDGAWETPDYSGNSFATGVDLERTGRNLSISITGNTGFTNLTDTVALPDETHVDSGTISGAPPVLDLHLSDGTDVTITGLPEGTTDWTDLTNTPSSIVANGCVKGNIAGDALSFGSSCGGGGGTGTADGKVIDFVADISGASLRFTVEQNEGLSNIVELLALTEPVIPDLPASKITSGTFGTAQIADDAVTQAKLANNSVHAAQIGANAVGTSEISANAVGTSELSADAVTNANLADDSVHNDQLAANSVRADEIQANAVGHSEMQDAAVGVVELRDDAAERLCPDPSTGTSGQVCARNAAGDAYELVTQTGGGGGGGTDDQTAAEVSFDATGLTGTLAALPDSSNVAAALTAIDGFTLGGGGGTPGTSEQRVESVTFADVDNITSTATTLTLAATTPIAVEFGDGTAEMLTGTAGETTFTIADSGVYMFEFAAIYPADGDRATPYVEIQQDSDDAVLGRSSNAYLRNSGIAGRREYPVHWRRRLGSERRPRGQGGARRTRTIKTAWTRTAAS